MKGSKPQVVAHTDPQVDRLPHARRRRHAARGFSLSMDNVGHLAPGGLISRAEGPTSGAGCGCGERRVAAGRTS